MVRIFKHFSFKRVLLQFIAGGFLLVTCGTILLVVELLGIFGTSFVIAAFTEGKVAQSPVSFIGILAFTVNILILPLLGSLFMILFRKAGNKTNPPGIRNFFLSTLSGGIVYAAFFVYLYYNAPEPIFLIVWPVHLGSWILVTFVQTVTMQL